MKAKLLGCAILFAAMFATGIAGTGKGRAGAEVT